MCEMYGLPVVYSGDESNEENKNSSWTEYEENQSYTFEEDRVILETEITLRSGSNITMKIHEESRSNSDIDGLIESEEDMRKMGVIRVLTEDSESDFYEQSRKTPRKVRFGGEQVKMRTPESDSSAQTDNEEVNIHKRKIDLTAVKHELSSIKITLTDAVAITTKKSLIPIRVTSLPSSPQRNPVRQGKRFTPNRRLHQSTPNLSNRNKNHISPSRIPRIKKENLLKTYKQKAIEESLDTNLEVPKPKKLQRDQETATISLPPSKSNGSLSPVPAHNQIEILHNLTRSPERSRSNSIVVDTDNENFKFDDDKNQTDDQENSKNDIVNYNSFQIVNSDKDASKPNEEENSDSPTIENSPTTSKNLFKENADFLKVSYCSFQVFKSSKIKDQNDSSVVIEEVTDKTEEITENTNSMHSNLQRSVSSLTSDDELWAKSEALDNVVKMLKQPETCQNLEAGPASLLFEALFACHHRDRLHNLADNALKLLVTSLRPEILQQCLPRVAGAVCKMGAPSGVRLAMEAMKKCSPKLFQREVMERGISHRTREGALQVFLGCLRLLPSTDVEVQKIVDWAAASLRDRRRKVKHAALEVLATAAQITSSNDVLRVVERTLEDFPEKNEVLEVMRIRLSRKQLPSVELDGSIRYASPVDPIELDWLSSTTVKQNGTPLPNKHQLDSTTNPTNQSNNRLSSAANRIQTEENMTNQNVVMANRKGSACSLTNQRTVPDHIHSSTTPSSSASSSTRSINYWRCNSRHKAMHSDITTNKLDESSNDDSTNGQPVIWALDPSGISRNYPRYENGAQGNVLHPVYVLQSDAIPTVNGRGYRRYDRGRSFSPPNRRKNQNNHEIPHQNQRYPGHKATSRKDFHSKDRDSDDRYNRKDKDGHNGSWQNLEGSSDAAFQNVKLLNHPGNRNSEHKCHNAEFRHGSRDHPFRKSFSSDQLYHLEKQQEKRKAGSYEPHSYSLSSNSSTTSIGSYSRIPNYWNKDFKSGIPVPISSERLKIKTNQANGIPHNGPMIALRTLPSANSPRLPQTTPPRPENHHHLPPHLPPRSSGSESSGYFTPPPGSGGDNQLAFVQTNIQESRGEVSSSADEVDHAPEMNRSSSSRRESTQLSDMNFVLEDMENNNSHEEEMKTPAKSSTPNEHHFGEELNNNYSFDQSSTASESNRIEIRSKRSTPSPAPLILAGTTSEIVPVKRKSKSVVELQNFLPDINYTDRKTTNSAPSRKKDENLRCWEIDTSDFNKPDDNIFDEIRKDVINEQKQIAKNSNTAHQIQGTEDTKPSENPLNTSRLERRFSRNNSRKSIKSTPRRTNEAVPMRPYAKPKDALHISLSQMESNEWETTIQGLQSLMRVARHHPEVVESQMHTVCLGLARHIKNLRSQVARAACQTAGELFTTCRRGLDMELEEIAGPLLQRTADTNKFLRADANSALDLMCDHLPLHRIIPVVTTRGCSHQNAVVRASSMRLLCKLVNALGVEKSMNMPKELRDRLILAGANSLTDGNLEARHQGKAMFGSLMGYPGFQRILNEVVPQNLLRHIAKTMATLK